MACALIHRGPDEKGFLFEPGLGFAHRRLSIVGLADGQQPMFNEDRSVAVVFNGELFDFPEKREELKAKGHRFATSCDTEILVHMWEEYREEMFERLRGQFAFALYDYRQKRIILARDRLGIVPLHWARRGNRLYFGSEVKAILASGEVNPEIDPHGIDQIFTLFALPTRRTCFEGISQVLPGHYLDIRLRDGAGAGVDERRYWDLDFPDRGEEYDQSDERVVEEFGQLLVRATEIRLRADVPVVTYLSGGVDSTTVLSAASRLAGGALPSFSLEIPDPSLNELDRAMLAADAVGSPISVVKAGSAEIAQAYPKLIEASDAPVMDTACAALLCLSAEVRAQGYKVALTGEGADEALAGYPWLKVNRLLNLFDTDTCRPSNVARFVIARRFRWATSWSDIIRFQSRIGGPVGMCDLYGLLHVCKYWFYSREFTDRLDGFMPVEDLDLDIERMKRWHPLNRALYFGYKTMLPGLLMNQKGDRPAMHNSVETRYPFLDEDVVSFCAKVHPRWKLHGLTRDKRLLREYASSLLPDIITQRPKKMFRAPFASSFFANPSPYVDQLLSREALRKTGLFDPDRVAEIRARYPGYKWPPGKRIFAEMGLTAVMATQLWAHSYLGGGLCELPAWSPPLNVAPCAQDGSFQNF
jgi:asparagine synthase (glutamine-hydrolysing)